MMSPTLTFIHFSLCSLQKQPIFWPTAPCKYKLINWESEATCRVASQLLGTYEPRIRTWDWRLFTWLSLLWRNCRSQRCEVLYLLFQIQLELMCLCVGRKTHAHIVIRGIFYCSDAQHQSQRHNGSEPGEGGDLRNQLWKERHDKKLICDQNI